MATYLEGWCNGNKGGGAVGDNVDLETQLRLFDSWVMGWIMWISLGSTHDQNDQDFQMHPEWIFLISQLFVWGRRNHPQGVTLSENTTDLSNIPHLIQLRTPVFDKNMTPIEPREGRVEPLAIELHILTMVQLSLHTLAQLSPQLPFKLTLKAYESDCTKPVEIC